MKFVVVNHEPPSREAACSSCSRPLQSGYIRHARTQRRYCDHDCYRRNEFAALMMDWSMPGLTATQATESIAAVASRAIEVLAVLAAVSCWSATMQMWTFSRALTEACLGAQDPTAMEGGGDEPRN